MPPVAETASPLLRRIADGGAHRLEGLEEIAARSLGLVRHDADAPAKGGLTDDARDKIGRAWESLARAGLVSYPRRGSVRITERGLAEIGLAAGRSEMQDGGARGDAPAEGAARPAFVSTGEIVTADSPPLTPEEIAVFDDIASGAEKPYRVPRSELPRIVAP